MKANGKETCRSENYFYFQELPSELQLKIFSYFTTCELCQVIAPVSKLWWTLSKDATLWKDLNFTIASDESRKSCCDVLSRCNLLKSLRVKSTIPLDSIFKSCANLIYLRELDLSFCTGYYPDSFGPLVSNCPFIEDLNLENCESVGEKVLGHIASLSNLRSLNLSQCICVTDNCINIITKNCRKLDVLLLDADTNISDKSVRELSEYCHETLVHLHVDACQLTDNGLPNLIKFRKLTTLKIAHGNELTNATLEVLINLPNLTDLTLCWLPRLTPQGLSKFFSSALNLKNLKLDALNIRDNSLCNLARKCQNLQSIVLSWCAEITDKGVESVINNCHSLCSLNFRGMYGLTDEILIILPSKLPRLDYLNLEMCTNICEESVIELRKHMPDLRVFYNAVMNKRPTYDEFM